MRHAKFSWLVSLAMAAQALSAAEVRAQNAVIRGFATGASNGQPLQGVNVVLTNDSGALLGTATNRDGFYWLSLFVRAWICVRYRRNGKK
jgi:hypothetical protein